MDYLVISNLLMVGALFFMTCPNDSRGLSLGCWPKDENSYQHRIWRVLPVKRMDVERRGSADGASDYRPLKHNPTKPDPNPGKIISRPQDDDDGRFDKYDMITGELIQKTSSADQKKNIMPDVEPSSYSSRLEACNAVRKGLREACRKIVLNEEEKTEPNNNEQILNDDPTILQLW